MKADLQSPTPRLLLYGYASGIFPMADPDTGRIDWFCPDPRAIIPLETFQVRPSLAREVRRGRFEIRTDTAFEPVIRACAGPRSREDLTWLDERLIEAYVGLFELGHVHTMEAWLDDQLVGGLYGVHLGGAFFGESMFIRPRSGGTNASKVCLVHLVRRMREQGFLLLDTQFYNPHLQQFGCVEIPREEYLQRLDRAIDRPAPWGPPGVVCPSGGDRAAPAG